MTIYPFKSIYDFMYLYYVFSYLLVCIYLYLNPNFSPKCPRRDVERKGTGLPSTQWVKSVFPGECFFLWVKQCHKRS